MDILALSLPTTKLRPVRDIQRVGTHLVRKLGNKNSRVNKDNGATRTSADIRPSLWSKPTVAMSLTTIYGTAHNRNSNNYGSKALTSAEGEHEDATSKSKPSIAKDMTEARGNARATIRNDGHEAVATADGEHGSAHAWTNGKYVDYTVAGNGRVVVGNGVAYASAGPDNAAIPMSLKAEKKASKHRSTRNQVVEAEDQNETRYEIPRY